MKLTFDSSEDSAAQARLLVEALAEWLADQPDEQLRGGKTDYHYRPDGTLDSVVITLDDPEDGE